MKRRLLFFTALLIVALMLKTSLLLPVMAMGKHPKAAKKAAPEECVSPEIQIISRPEMNIKLLSEQGQDYQNPVSVSPAEVLPAVGKDSSTIAKKIRITDIQKALKGAGFNPGHIDGQMGPKTKKVIREFQRENNLTIDGVVGPKTWEKLKTYL
ncbi:MAG: peptidoglycan-binding protein [PVC group bacterium]|nr:peptidoglycan-binding protein [PVC group bacterium]